MSQGDDDGDDGDDDSGEGSGAGLLIVCLLRPLKWAREVSVGAAWSLGAAFLALLVTNKNGDSDQQ